MNKRIRVLIVDDSAFARKVIREILSRDSEIEVVGIARDGLEALEKVPELKPDVVTLDLLMPDLDGLGFLRALPKSGAPRVIVVSASAAESDLAVEALECGAVDLVTKPTPLPTDRLYDLSSDLVAKVKAAALATPRTVSDRIEATTPDKALVPTAKSASARLVVIGTSTGGPQALTTLFRALPAGLPVPIVVALHIPAGYTEPLAARLSKNSLVPLVEARTGMEILPGTAVIAPGGMHVRVRESAGKFYAVVTREPLASIYHPSVDLLFESAAEAAGDGVLALIMTGMGNDGFEGSKTIRRLGGRVLTESASSCVVYGMPRCAVEGGTSNFEAPLERLANLLVTQIFESL